MFLLMITLKQKIGTLGGNKIAVSIFKLTIGATGGILVMFISYSEVAKHLPSSNWFIAINLFISSIIFALVYLVILKLLRSEEVTTAYFVLKKAIKRIKAN